MKHKALLAVMMLSICVTIAPAQETPPSIVVAYDAMADTILSLRATEHGFVRAMLDGHRHAAAVRYSQGNWQAAAAEIALFANEGDNAIGGVRKRLLEGGHHFNADGEEQGLFEPGYIVVTSDAKKKLLGASAALRQAADDMARQVAWGEFDTVATELLGAQ